MSYRDRLALLGGVLLVAALTLLPWRSGGATAIQAPGLWFGVAAALTAATAVAWLAAAVLMPRPPVPDPGRSLVILGGVTLALVAIKLATDFDGLAVGAWTSLGLAAGLVALASRRTAPATT